MTLTPPSGTMAIYKYRLDPWSTGVTMPTGAVLRHVHAQGSEAFVWAEVDPNAELVERRIECVPTGSMPPLADYIGTFHIDAGLVFHVYATEDER